MPCWWSNALWFLAGIQDRKTDSKWSRISYFIGFWFRVLGLVSKINIGNPKHMKDHEDITALLAHMHGLLTVRWTSEWLEHCVRWKSERKNWEHYQFWQMQPKNLDLKSLGSGKPVYVPFRKSLSFQDVLYGTKTSCDWEHLDDEQHANRKQT